MSALTTKIENAIELVGEIKADLDRFAKTNTEREYFTSPIIRAQGRLGALLIKVRVLEAANEQGVKINHLIKRAPKPYELVGTIKEAKAALRKPKRID